MYSNINRNNDTNDYYNNSSNGIVGEKKYDLILCELHFIGRHGKTSNSDPNIDTHYIVYDRYEPFTGLSYSHLDDYIDYDTDTEYDTDDDEEYINENRLVTINNEIEFLKQMLLHNSNIGSHPIIRNYNNIVRRPNYIKPEIAQCIVLPTQETIAILKTFWLRIIQRKWKKVFKNKKDIIRRYCNLRNLYTREMNRITIPILPSLKGMLSDLKH